MLPRDGTVQDFLSLDCQWPATSSSLHTHGPRTCSSFSIQPAHGLLINYMVNLQI